MVQGYQEGTGRVPGGYRVGKEGTVRVGRIQRWCKEGTRRVQGG